jgi:hypothetical protein
VIMKGSVKGCTLPKSSLDPLMSDLYMLAGAAWPAAVRDSLSCMRGAVTPESASVPLRLE